MARADSAAVFQPIHADGTTDVFQLPLAEIGQLDAKLIPDVVADGRRHHDLTRTRELLYPRRDVHAIPMALVSIDDHVFHIDADAHREGIAFLLISRFGDRALDVMRPSHG